MTDLDPSYSQYQSRILSGELPSGLSNGSDRPIASLDSSTFLSTPSSPTSTPFLPNAPQRAQQFTSRYGPDSPIAQAVPQQSLRPVERIEATRLSRGSNQLSDRQFANALRSSHNIAQHVPQPDRSMVQGAVGNVQDIATGMLPWRLIPGLVQEIKELPKIPQRLAEAAAASSNPLQFIGNAAQAPGIRFAPTAYVAAELFGQQMEGSPYGGGGVSELVQNPVFAALDVLPLGISAARRTATVQKAMELSKTNTALTGELPRRVRPIQTLLRHYTPRGIQTQTLKQTDEYGARGVRQADDGKGYVGNERKQIEVLIPNAYGRFMQRGRERFKATGPGKTVFETWGRDAQDMNKAVDRQRGIIAMNIDPSKHGARRRAAMSDELQRVASKQAAFLRSEQAKPFIEGIPETRRQAIGDMLQRDDKAGLAKLSKLETEFVAVLREQTAEMSRVTENAGHIGRHTDLAGKSELYDVATARKLSKARTALDQAQGAQYLRDIIDNPQSATLRELVDVTERLLRDTKLQTKQATRLVAAIRAIAEAHYGPRGKSLFDDVHRAQNRSQKLAALESTKRMYSGDIAKMQRSWHGAEGKSLAKEVNAFVRDPKSDPLVRLVGHLRDGDWKAVRDHATRYKSQARKLPDDLSGLLDRVDWIAREYIAADKARNQLSKAGFGASAADDALARLTKMEANNAPARFYGLLWDDFQRKITDQLVATNKNLDRAAISQIVNEGRWDVLAGADKKLIDTIRKEVEQSWQQLRDVQGFDPMFVHRVDDAAAQKLITAPTPLDTPRTLSYTKKRTWHESATVRDPLIAITAQAMEVLLQNGQKALVKELTGTQALTGAMLREQYTPKARALSEITGRPFTDTLNELMKRDGWAPWSTDNLFPPTDKTVRKGASAAEQLYLPRDVAATLEKLKPSAKDMGTLLDKPTSIFRTALLPLSPRWHVYNIVGNTVMMMAQARNPITVWRHTREAWAMAKDARTGGGMFERSKLATPTGELMTHGQYAAQFGKMGREARAFGFYHYQGGSKLRQLYDQARDSRLGQSGARFIEKSYELNNIMDNFARSMSYLENRAAFAKSVTPEQAAAWQKLGMSVDDMATAHGIAHARRVLQEWDTMTPMERSALRFAMPFYSWTRTILRYVAQYPADHPYRLNIVSTIARTELNDAQTGLPQQLRDLLFIGNPDEWGNVTGINITGSSPFRDISNYASMVGFFASLGETGDMSVVTSSLNPAAGAFLQWMGVDTMRGTSGLFPELVYNPQSGQLEVVQPDNPFQSTLEQYIPQTRTITAMLGFNEFYRDLAQRDPEAASRMLLSSMGVPVTYRRINVREQHALETLRRLSAFDDTRRAAFSSGDLAEISRKYPELAPLVETLQQIQATGQFSAPEFNPGRRSIAGRMLIPANPVPTS